MSATTDRAAIEALARELTDDDWSLFLGGLRWIAPAPAGVRRLADLGIIEFAGSYNYVSYTPTARGRALLAYLDEVWAGLDAEAREALASDRGDACSTATGHALSCEYLIEVRPPTDHDFTCVGYWRTTPLGRAVLKRAQERR